MLRPRHAFRARALLLGAAAVFTAACGSDDPTGPGDPGDPAPVASVTINPASADMAVGATASLSAVTKDAGGATLTGRTVTWSSMPTSVATVSSSGVVTAVAEGDATITATSEGQSGTATITVTPAPVATVTVSPDESILVVGATTDLAAETKLAGGEVVTGRDIAWSSSDEGVATVDASGTVSALSSGSATITATSEGQSGSADLTVFLPFSQIVSGGATCALDGDGNAYCWGGNGNGEVGVGDLDPHLAPTAVAGDHTFTQLGAGFSFVCGLDDAGSAWCWGLNVVGQIGNGSAADFQVIPAAVSGGLTFDQIAVGGDHACGLVAGGDAWCWGYNLFGQLGDGTTTDSNVPVQVTGGLTFESLGLGSYHTCGVTDMGDAYCWGRGSGGQIGDGSNDAASSGPVAVSGGLTFATIDGGQSHTCAWTAGGDAYCWGNNDFGQLGDGTTTSQTAPVAVTGGLAFAEANSSGYLSCGTVAPGSNHCWGWNARGEIGDGTMTDATAPTAPSGGPDFVTIVAGFQTACGLTDEGLAYCWGANDDGVIGDGTFDDRSTPTMVLPAE